MGTPREQLVESLKFLKEMQDKGVAGIHTDEIPDRKYRELLAKYGFIREVTKGWLIPTDLAGKASETPSWAVKRLPHGLRSDFSCPIRVQ